MALPELRKPSPHPRYAYLTADLRTGAILEEVPLGGVQFSRTLNDAGTLSGQFAYTAQSAALLRPATEPARTALYVLRDGRAVWGGIIWTRRIDHAARVVSIGCADWWSYFDHRYIGVDVSGGELVVDTPDYIDTDQNDVARDLVALAQAYTGGDLGVEASTGTSGTNLDITFDWFNFATVGETLRQIATGENGCDIRFDTAGDVASGFRRLLVIGTPTLGRDADTTGLVFDAGGQGAILDSLVEDEDGSTVETVHYALGPGDGEAKLTGVAESALVDSGWPRLEGSTSYNDDTLDSDEAINARARADLAARSGVRTLPSGSTRAVAPGLIDPGDEVVLEVEADWYNDDPSAAFTGIWRSSTRVTSFTYTVPDDGSAETLEPVFGDLVVTSRGLTRGAPSVVETFALPTSTLSPVNPTTYGDGGYGEGIFGE